MPGEISKIRCPGVIIKIPTNYNPAQIHPNSFNFGCVRVFISARCVDTVF